MAIFHQTVWDGDPDLEFYFPLQDEEGNVYHSADEAKSSFIEGKRLFHVHEVNSGLMILEQHLLPKYREWELVSDHDDVNRHLLVAAEKLSFCEYIVREGEARLCEAGAVRVFGGYGKDLHGKTWAHIEVNTHQEPSGTLLSALLMKGLIDNKLADLWSEGQPSYCNGEHKSAY